MSMYKQNRRLSASALQRLCQDKGLYTGGTVKEFEAVLELADDSPNINADLLAAIADDILSRLPGTAYNLESIMWELNKASNVSFVYVGGNPELGKVDE